MYGLTDQYNNPSDGGNIFGVNTNPSPEPLAQSEGVAANKGATTGTLIGAGLGLLSSLGAQNAYEAQAKAAAAQTRWSPWTRMGAGKMPDAPNALGQVAGLAASGATLGQAIGGGSVAPIAYMNRPYGGWNGLPQGQGY
jgi:hypothetical protein